MENIIGKLLEIDQAACKLVEDAAKQRESSLASLSDMKKSIYDSCLLYTSTPAEYSKTACAALALL